jgi:hypothetical protein
MPFAEGREFCAISCIRFCCTSSGEEVIRPPHFPKGKAAAVQLIQKLHRKDLLSLPAKSQLNQNREKLFSNQTLKT